MELTKYELARIIGARANQLAAGAPPMVSVGENPTFISVAELEFAKSVIPLEVLRKPFSS